MRPVALAVAAAALGGVFCESGIGRPRVLGGRDASLLRGAGPCSNQTVDTGASCDNRGYGTSYRCSGGSRGDSSCAIVMSPPDGIMCKVEDRTCDGTPQVYLEPTATWSDAEGNCGATYKFAYTQDGNCLSGTYDDKDRNGPVGN